MVMLVAVADVGSRAVGLRASLCAVVGMAIGEGIHGHGSLSVAWALVGASERPWAPVGVSERQATVSQWALVGDNHAGGGIVNTLSQMWR